MKNNYLIPNHLCKLIKASCKVLGLALLSTVSISSLAQMYTEDNLYIDEDGEVVVFGAQTFDATNVVETARTGNRGYFSFGPSATWTAAANASHVDGYARHYVNGAFVMPIGDNGAYRPIATTAGPTDAAYYAVNPNGSYPVATTASDVANVSTIEYWDIDGTVATSVTLTWNATSDIATITGNDLTKLIMVGWDGTEWVKIPATISTSTLNASTSTPVFTGGAGTLTVGSITTDATITPNDFEAFTFASEGEVCLAAKAYLQGALLLSANSTMTDDLRSNGLIPTSEPYGAMTNFTHVGGGGSETTTSGVLSTTGNNAIVDWVFLELRDANNSATVVETQSALIQRDGDIVDATDGTSNVCFSGLASNTVFVAVRHRNHLGVMANSSVTLTPGGTSVDFSTTTLHGTNAATTVNSVTALRAGNVDSDHRLIYDGSGSDATPVLNTVMANPANTFLGGSRSFPYTNIYSTRDVNMNGTIVYDGANSDATHILNIVMAHPANTFLGGSRSYSGITEQLP